MVRSSIMENKKKIYIKWFYFFIAIVLFTHSLFGCISAYRRIPIPVLLLHSVGKPLLKSDIWGISINKFSSILENLRAKGFRTLTLKEVDQAVNHGVRPENPPYCLITFDDGCRSHLSTVVPLLKKYSYTGVFFVPLPYLESRAFDDGKKKNAFLKKTEINGLLAAGTIQSHSRTFQTLPIKQNEKIQDFKKRMKQDIGDYKSTLENITKEPVYALAYPSGEYDKNVVNATEKSGYRLAFTTEYAVVSQSSKPLLLPRFMITKHNDVADVMTFVYDDSQNKLLIAMIEIIAAILCFIVFKRR